MAVITRQRGMTQESEFGSLAAGALLVGGIGTLFGLGAFLAVVIGDPMIPFETAAIMGAGLIVVGLIGTVIVRDLPDVAAFAMAIVPFGLYFAVGDKLSPWWNTYQAAIQSGGAAENALWTSSPAMGLFVFSAVLFAFGAILAAFSWGSKARI